MNWNRSILKLIDGSDQWDSINMVMAWKRKFTIKQDLTLASGEKKAGQEVIGLKTIRFFLWMVFV